MEKIQLYECSKTIVVILYYILITIKMLLFLSEKMKAMLIVILVGLCALCYKSCPSSVSGYQCICKCYDDIMECRNSCNMENVCWITCATTYSACLRDCVNSNWFIHVVKQPDQLVPNNSSFCQLNNTCICIWILRELK